MFAVLLTATSPFGTKGRSGASSRFTRVYAADICVLGARLVAGLHSGCVVGMPSALAGASMGLSPDVLCAAAWLRRLGLAL